MPFERNSGRSACTDWHKRIPAALGRKQLIKAGVDFDYDKRNIGKWKWLRC
jgi:hypothetical protein